MVELPTLRYALTTVEATRALTSRPYSARLGGVSTADPALARSPSTLDSRVDACLRQIATFSRRYSLIDPVTEYLTFFEFNANAFREVDRTVRGIASRGWQLCDSHEPDLWYAGTCSALIPGAPDPCPRELYVPVGLLAYRCPSCRTLHDVLERRDVLKSHMREMVVHAGLASRLLQPFIPPGWKFTPQHIYDFRRRGRLEPVFTDMTTKPHRPHYRLGDIIDLIPTPRN